MNLGFDSEKLKSGYLNLPDYQKILITFGVLAALIGLYFYLIFMPKQAQMEALVAKHRTMTQTISQNKAVEASLPRFEAEHKMLNTKLAQALEQLPSSDELPTLIQNMESVATESSVEFNKLSLSKEKPKGFYVEVPVDLKLSGSYHDIATFFDRLSGLPRIINVSGLSFSSPKDIDGKVVLEVSCRASIFKFAEKKQKKGKKGKKK